MVGRYPALGVPELILSPIAIVNARDSGLFSAGQ
jgi:hypothetical protein